MGRSDIKQKAIMEEMYVWVDRFCLGHNGLM